MYERRKPPGRENRQGRQNVRVFILYLSSSKLFGFGHHIKLETNRFERFIDHIFIITYTYSPQRRLAWPLRKNRFGSNKSKKIRNRMRSMNPSSRNLPNTHILLHSSVQTKKSTHFSIPIFFCYLILIITKSHSYFF